MLEEEETDDDPSSFNDDFFLSERRNAASLNSLTAIVSMALNVVQSDEDEYDGRQLSEGAYSHNHGGDKKDNGRGLFGYIQDRSFERQ